MGPEQQIEEYIRANRGRYTREAITDQLIAAGHDPAAVEATWERLGVASPGRMIDPKIADYINANRRRYTDQAIRQQLIAAGHSPADIEATWAALEVPDPDATIGPRFWRYFWIWVLVTYGLGFLLVALSTGLLTGGFGMVAVAILAVLLAIAVLISWAIVAAVRPTRMSPAVAAAIGGIVPLLFLFLVGGTCYAIVAGVGPPPPPATRGTMELEIDPPIEFRGSGPAFCQSHGEVGAGYSVFSEELGRIGDRAVTVSLDVFASAPAPQPRTAPAPGVEQASVFINLSSGDTGHGGYGPVPRAEFDLDAAPDGLSGTIAFEQLEPMAFEGPESDTEPISGRITWNCE